MYQYVSIASLVVEHFTPIQIASLQTHDQHFCAGQIGSNGNIVLIAMADGFDHLGIVPGFFVVGIGEQQHQIDLIVSDTSIDLLMKCDKLSAVRDVPSLLS